MEIKKDGKTLYFSDDEINNETNGEKKVFVTKRINGKETHTKAEKLKKRSQPTKSENSFDFNNEIVIGVNNKPKNSEKQNNVYKKRKKNKKYRSKSKKRKIFFITTFMLAIVIIVFTLTAPIFNVTNIEVEGNNNVSTQNIINYSGIIIGENIFKYNNNGVVPKIKENPYLKEAKIRKILPGTIVIAVEEREVNYQIKLINSYVYIDEQGYILENSNEKKQVPVIAGLKTTEEELLNSKRLITEDLEKLNDIIKIMDASKAIEIDALITEINIEDKYALYLESEMKKIYIEDTKNLTNKMLFIKEIIEHEKEKKGTIRFNKDLSTGLKPVFREE